jgi:ectoine hydroxylase-related dioxygenase (phytanoyl-CoA dioxygenase family)
VRLLALLGPLQPRGGGTMLLAGSHRLVERLAAGQSGDDGHSKDVRRLLRRAHPALSFLDRGSDVALSTDLLSAGLPIDGAQVRLVEVIGAAGDVFFMHPWLLHAAAMNGSPLPRLMLSQSIFRRSSDGAA